jgi:hypothetical protein
MQQITKIKRLKLRDIWEKEAADFTPRLAENIQALSEVPGWKPNDSKSYTFSPTSNCGDL